MVFLAVSFTSHLQAQTKNCTSAQVAACKKNETTAKVANCTPAQVTACQKTGTEVTTPKVATQDNPSLDFFKLVNDTSEGKKTACVKTCQPAQLTKNEKPSCKKKSAVAATEENPKAPIAQTVSVKAGSSEE